MSAWKTMKEPTRTTGPRERLISDIIIGGCLGSIFAFVLISNFDLDPGITGIACTSIGAVLGAIWDQVQKAHAITG
jgi:hypothetical protein